MVNGTVLKYLIEFAGKVKVIKPINIHALIKKIDLRVIQNGQTLIASKMAMILCNAENGDTQRRTCGKAMTIAVHSKIEQDVIMMLMVGIHQLSQTKFAGKDGASKLIIIDAQVNPYLRIMLQTVMESTIKVTAENGDIQKQMLGTPMKIAVLLKEQENANGTMNGMHQYHLIQSVLKVMAGLPGAMNAEASIMLMKIKPKVDITQTNAENGTTQKPTNGISMVTAALLLTQPNA